MVSNLKGNTLLVDEAANPCGLSATARLQICMCLDWTQYDPLVG